MGKDPTVQQQKDQTLTQVWDALNDLEQDVVLKQSRAESEAQDMTNTLLRQQEVYEQTLQRQIKMATALQEEMCREKKVRQQLEQFVSPKSRQVATKMALVQTAAPQLQHTLHT